MSQSSSVHLFKRLPNFLNVLSCEKCYQLNCCALFLFDHSVAISFSYPNISTKAVKNLNDSHCFLTLITVTYTLSQPRINSHLNLINSVSSPISNKPKCKLFNIYIFCVVNYCAILRILWSKFNVSIETNRIFTVLN